MDESIPCNQQGIHGRDGNEQEVIIAAAEHMIGIEFFLMVTFCHFKARVVNCHQSGEERNFHAFIAQFAGAGLYKPAFIQKEDRFGVNILPEVCQQV